MKTFEDRSVLFQAIEGARRVDGGELSTRPLLATIVPTQLAIAAATAQAAVQSSLAKLKEELAMIARVSKGKWLKRVAQARKHSGRLGRDSLDAFIVRLELLTSRVEPGRGMSAEEAERQVQNFQRVLEGIDPSETVEARHPQYRGQ